MLANITIGGIVKTIQQTKKDDSFLCMGASKKPLNFLKVKFFMWIFRTSLYDIFDDEKDIRKKFIRE